MATRALHGPTNDRPPLWLALTELPRALYDYATLARAMPLIDRAPRGDGHPVLVLPGFTTTDASTALLRRYLCRMGHDARTWDLGRNLGPRAIGQEGEKLVARLADLHHATGRKVSLVGWSLGGVMARIVAQRAPDQVRRMVTMGAPFAGDPHATRVWRLYEYLTGHRIADPRTAAQLAESAAPARVPSTAIYSRADGIVPWQHCIDRAGDRIAVRGSHCGLGVNPAVLYAVADRLAQVEGDRHRFVAPAPLRHLYPDSSAA